MGFLPGAKEVIPYQALATFQLWMRYIFSLKISSAPPKKKTTAFSARFYTTTTPTTLTAWIMAKLAKRVLVLNEMTVFCYVYHQKFMTTCCNPCIVATSQEMFQDNHRRHYYHETKKEVSRRWFLLATHVAALAKGRNLQLNPKIRKTFHPWQWSVFLGWLPQTIKVHHVSSLNETTFS